MYEAIKNFAKQFEYEPEIQNRDSLKLHGKFIVVGMGGSHLAADILKEWDPSIDVVLHSNYGLPALPEETLKNSLIIASSYSGNTEEVIDAFEEAIERKLPVAVISIGGKLIELAKKHSVPYVQMPDTGIQPRLALGFSLRALLKITGKEDVLKETRELADSLRPADYQDKGLMIAKELKGFIPVIYSSARNFAVAYNWKIKFNETGKIPAFYNVFPELNHNEMTGYDIAESTKDLSRNFCFIFLKDASDNPRIIKRMEVLEKLYRHRKLPVKIIEMENNSGVFHKIFSTLLIADWAAYYTARQYDVDPEEVPMVEEFKKMISKT